MIYPIGTKVRVIADFDGGIPWSVGLTGEVVSEFGAHPDDEDGVLIGYTVQLDSPPPGEDEEILCHHEELEPVRNVSPPLSIKETVRA